MAEHRYGRDTSGKPLDRRATFGYRTDLVVSAARIELGLASDQFARHQDRRSHQRLKLARSRWRSLSEGGR